MLAKNATVWLVFGRHGSATSKNRSNSRRSLEPKNLTKSDSSFPRAFCVLGRRSTHAM